ncbi:hypothetical protein BaRGS_00031763, partial [Batillaria attramentaria]
MADFLRHLLVTVVVMLMMFGRTSGHGRLVEPPSRSSMWRFGFKTPVNDDDNGLNCGGSGVQYSRNQGKCGVCGDPWNEPVPRENEAGGRYGNGIITRTYTPGQVMDVRVDITANHKGWFEFRLCPHNDPSTPITQQCLDQYLLQMADGSGTRYQLGGQTGYVDLKLKLPAGLTCSQCVLQWKYHGGNNWGFDRDTGRSCLGCGDQEEFYGCSDIAISGSSAPNTSYPTITTSPAHPSTGPLPGTCRAVGPWQGNTDLDRYCEAIGPWQGVPDLDSYCRSVCPGSGCPLQYCSCPKPATCSNPATAPPPTSTTTTTPIPGTCRAINAWRGSPELDLYCQSICPGPGCPGQYCACGTRTVVPATRPTTSPAPSTRPPTTTTTTTTTIKAASVQPTGSCRAIGAWRGSSDLDLYCNNGNTDLDQYCSLLCARGDCPAQLCSCSAPVTTAGPSLITTTPRTTTAIPLPTATSAPPATTRAALRCYGINSWQGNPSLDKWCDNNCAIGICPTQTCACSGPSSPVTAALTTATPATKPTFSSFSTVALRQCRAVGAWAGQAVLDQWCTETCAQFRCDPQYCSCTTCHAVGSWAGVPQLDEYCDNKCRTGFCPSDVERVLRADANPSAFT